MNYTEFMYGNLKVISPNDCGNAPKKVVLKELNIAFAKSDLDFILEKIADDIHLKIIGDQSVQGKENVKKFLKQMESRKVLELHISNIITHGKTASADGSILLESRKKYAFCHVYLFTNAGKNAKLKNITSYIIKTS